MKLKLWKNQSMIKKKQRQKLNLNQPNKKLTKNNLQLKNLISKKLNQQKKKRKSIITRRSIITNTIKRKRAQVKKKVPMMILMKTTLKFKLKQKVLLLNLTLLSPKPPKKRRLKNKLKPMLFQQKLKKESKLLITKTLPFLISNP